MPQGKTRRKDDTWTTEDLTHALKGSRGEDPEKKRRSRDDDDRKERRRHRDEVNGDDSRRKDDSKRSHKRDEDGHSKGRRGVSRGDVSSEPQVELTEEEREQLRQERREKRGGTSDKKEDRPRKKEEKPVDSNDDDARRRRRDDDDKRRSRHADEEGGERRHSDKARRHRDDEGGDGDRRGHKERKESRHRDADGDDQRQLDEDEREKRRQERREKRDRKDDDGRKDKGDQRSKRDRDDKHRDKEDRHDKDERRKDRDREDRHKDRDREERHKDREERRKDRDRDDRHKDRGDRDERKRREKEEKEREERKRKEGEDRKKKEKEPAKAANDDYEDDFEDYEDDFEDEDELKEEGEMEEVLRALDEENARLTSQSHRSNWSDSTELSDEKFRESQEDTQEPGEEPVRKERPQKSEKPSQGRSFINFVSAKQRVMNQSVAGKARRRANDLAKMIQLDVVYYDMFDLPPVREYELYIRSFGRSDTKQAYVQTNEDAVEREVQTEEVDDLDKWTQHPAEDLMGVGGEGITVATGADEKSLATNPELAARFGKFLEQASQVVSVLLEEEKVGADDAESDRREKTSNLQISEGFSSLGCPAYLAGRYVERTCFCPLEPNAFLTLYSKPEQPSPDNMMDAFGVICVWSVKEPAFPQKVLTCVTQPTCACFSPARASLVIAGMVDGSVMLWDLREPSSLHRAVYVHDVEVVMRFPTYNTAGVLEKENHNSPVTSITAVHTTFVKMEGDDSSATDGGSGLSFQLASVEENAIVNLWVVTEISVPDTAGSEVDLGLAPGGRVKLLRSSAIVLDNHNKSLASGNPRAFDIKLNPSDLNHFFVATDLGLVIHGVRFGSRVYPRVFQPEIESPRKVTCISFSPFGEPYFLAGCEDGSVHLYHTSSARPLISWNALCEGHPIVTVEWSQSRPAVFFVLAANSSLHMFDLVETGAVPVHSDQITAGRATSFSVSSDPALIGASKSQPAHILLSLDNGATELHTMRPGLRQQQPLEMDFMAHYLERY